MGRRPSLDNLDRFHDNNLFVPTRTIYIGSEENSIEDGESGTDGAMAERVIKNLHILESISNDPINIIMNNIGGDVFHGMAIYDAIRACNSRVIIKATGYVMSMGSIIFQAGDERILTPHSVMMIHHGYDSHDNHVKTVRNWVEFGKKFDEVIVQIYLDKIREKNPNFKRNKLDNLLDFDTLLFPEDAVKLGLADKVADKK